MGVVHAKPSGYALRSLTSITENTKTTMLELHDCADSKKNDRSHRSPNLPCQIPLHRLPEYIHAPISVTGS